MTVDLVYLALLGALAVLWLLPLLIIAASVVLNRGIPRAGELPSRRKPKLRVVKGGKRS